MADLAAPPVRGRVLPYLNAIAVLLAAIRGEVGIDDDALLDLISAEPDSGARKALVVGLNAHALISDEQAAGAFAFFKLREA